MLPGQNNTNNEKKPHSIKDWFNGKQILIMSFESDNDLRLTLAHELGHALVYNMQTALKL